MSWGFSVPQTRTSGFAAAATTAADTYQANLAEADYQLDPAAVEAISKAIAAAQVVVDSGVVGTGTVTASLSGHANPGHKPTGGWANDFVNITVSCADSYQAPPAEGNPA